MATIQLTVPEFLRYLYGDNEANWHDRAWLRAYTLASGYCTVIDEAHSVELFKLDNADFHCHIEVYNTAAYKLGPYNQQPAHPPGFNPAKVSAKIHTLWRLQEWRESNERQRLLRSAANTTKSNITAQHICEWIANDYANKLFRSGAEHTLNFSRGLAEKAKQMSYNIPAFIGYIEQLNTQIGVAHNINFQEYYQHAESK